MDLTDNIPLGSHRICPFRIACIASGLVIIATAGAREFYPNQFKTGKLGACNATMTELWNTALAA